MNLYIKSPKALHKPNPYKHPQALKVLEKKHFHRTTAKVHQRWVPKTLLQAQGFYKGKTSIWVPKQGQKQVHKPQAQAQQINQKQLVKPNQGSACTITNLETKTITQNPRTTSHLKPQRTGSILKQAQWILQLMQAKISQATVVQYFEAISQAPHTKIAEKEPTLKHKTKGPTQVFSS